jgi:hypothetical protein
VILRGTGFPTTTDVSSLRVLWGSTSAGVEEIDYSDDTGIQARAVVPITSSAVVDVVLTYTSGGSSVNATDSQVGGESRDCSHVVFELLPLCTCAGGVGVAVRWVMLFGGFESDRARAGIMAGHHRGLDCFGGMRRGHLVRGWCNGGNTDARNGGATQSCHCDGDGGDGRLEWSGVWWDPGCPCEVSCTCSWGWFRVGHVAAGVWEQDRLPSC